MNSKVREWIQSLFLIVAGVFVMTISYNIFLVPAKIAPGGVSGAATIFHYLSGKVLPIGALSFAMNLPLFLLGWKQEGRAFIVKTLISTALLSLFLDTLKLPIPEVEPLLAAIFGGAILGIGLGLVVLGDATTGGTDLAAKMIQRKVPHLTIAWVLFILDMIVVIAAAIAFSPAEGLYAMVTIFISTKLMDFILEGSKSSRAFNIITKKADVISERIMNELERGVTLFKGTGMFTGNEVSMLYCVVSSREIVKVKHIIQSEDPKAFIVVSEVHDVGGEGFTYNKPERSLFKKKSKE
ncbi:MAG: YitT family protein [Clostridia bacterium]|nr:YitT family protein [Clostridia bacterium]